MRYLKILGLLGICFFAAAPYAHAQRIGIGVGIGARGLGYYGGPAYVGHSPACSYGYYDYYPYACAPYGYYGPSYFSGGVFIGAGPWFRGGFGPGFRSFGGGRGFRWSRTWWLRRTWRLCWARLCRWRRGRPWGGRWWVPWWFRGRRLS